MITFDAIGGFGGYSDRTAPCADRAMYGTYRLSPGLFQLTSNVGMGLCQWWFTAGYTATFDSSGIQLTLTPTSDNCTGGRGYLNGITVLTRR